MAFSFFDLDEKTRTLMLDELSHDFENGEVYISARLNNFGVKQYPTILKNSLAQGTERSFAQDLSGCFSATEQRRTQKGGYTTAKIPVNANETLAEGEFNRFYIRALCRRAMEEGRQLQVYRAKPVSKPRPESLAKVGQTVNPQALLTDLRNNIGIDTHLRLPAGPNSGLSVRLA